MSLSKLRRCALPIAIASAITMVALLSLFRAAGGGDAAQIADPLRGAALSGDNTSTGTNAATSIKSFQPSKPTQAGPSSAPPSEAKGAKI